jgi:hypothetical protein
MRKVYRISRRAEVGALRALRSMRRARIRFGEWR